MCLRGSRSSSGSLGVPVAVDLIPAQGHLATNDVNFLMPSVGLHRCLFVGLNFLSELYTPLLLLYY